MFGTLPPFASHKHAFHMEPPVRPPLFLPPTTHHTAQMQLQKWYGDRVDAFLGIGSNSKILPPLPKAAAAAASGEEGARDRPGTPANAEDASVNR